MNVSFHYLFFYFFFLSTIFGEITHRPLFVSLGSHCHVTTTLRACKLRNEAFPFDWITSFDGEHLIQSLRDDCSGFFENEHFSTLVVNRRLRNIRYNFEFPHEEGSFSSESYDQDLERFKSKYKRRVNIFNQLNQCHKKVYFLREAILGNFDDVEPYPFSDLCRVISEEFAVRLYHEIKVKFPDLDAYLIIINHEDGPIFELDKVIDN